MSKRILLALMIAAGVRVVAVSWQVEAGSDESDSAKDQAAGVPDAAMTEIGVTVSKGSEAGIPLDSLSLVVVYDNNPHGDGLRSEWGFSCLIEGPRKTILFDTGGEGAVLMANMEALGLDPREIDVVVLSHAHRDHTGGLNEFLKVNPDVVVYVPQSFDEGFKRRASDHARQVVDIDQTISICENVYSTGEMGYSIKEQGLVVRTRRGLIVVTGCAHPGIVRMVERVASLDDEVLLVLGGFHLVRTGKDELAEVVRGLKDAGVKYAAPCHCSGDMAREVFHEEFGSRYIEVGVGRFIEAQDLD